MHFQVSWKDTQFESQKAKIVDIVGFISTFVFSQYIPLVSDFPNVEVTFVSATEITQLNKTYRDKDKATDVLSFEIHENNTLGELYICLEEIFANAEYYDSSFEEEILMIVVHGVLHLSGMDHSDTMFELQDKIVAQIKNDHQVYFRTRESGKKVRKDKA